MIDLFQSVRQLHLRKVNRVNPVAIHGNLPVNVWAGAAPCVPAQADHIALQNILTWHDVPRRKVRILAKNSPTVIDDDALAVNVQSARKHDSPVSGSQHWSPNCRVQILSGMAALDNPVVLSPTAKG